MANVNAPYGAIPVFPIDGGCPFVKVFPKKTGAAIYMYDFVMHDASGGCVVAAASNELLGVAAESKASADDTIAVFCDPEQVFEIQVSADFAAADVFTNCNIVANAADTALSRSKHTALSTFTTTATLPLKVLGLSPQLDNAVGSYAKILVKINAHSLGGGTGATGV